LWENNDLKVATLLSHFPTGNIRYAELMKRMVGKVNLHVWATIGSGYPKIEGLERFVRSYPTNKGQNWKALCNQVIGTIGSIPNQSRPP
jgi:hypothetical protein